MTRGFSLYIAVVAALKHRPRTAAMLCAYLKRPVAVEKLRRALRRLLDAGVLRVAGWTEGKSRERVFGVADGRPNVPHPSGFSDAPAKPMRHVTKFAMIWSELAEPTSAAELSEAIGPSVWSGRKLMQQMAAAGLVGITYSVSRTGRRTALYQIGAASEERPRLLSEAERWKRLKAAREGRKLHQIFTFRAAPLPARLGL